MKILNKNIGIDITYIKKHRKKIEIIILLSLIPISHFYNIIITLILGKEWKLNSNLIYLICAQEIVRIYFQFSNVPFLRMDNSRMKSKIAIGLLLIFLIITSVFTVIFKEWGIPLGMILSYLISIRVVRENAR